MALKVGRKRYAVRQAQELLSEVVAFAEAPVSDLMSRASRRTLHDVLTAGPVVVVGDQQAEINGTSDGSMPPWRPSQWAALQLRLRPFFRGLVAAKDGGLVPELSVGPLRFGAAGHRNVVLTVDGDAASVIAFQVAQLVQRAGADSLQACLASDCERIVARTGRREYCSDRCQKRAYMRDRRAAERAERERLLKGRRHGKTTRTR